MPVYYIVERLRELETMGIESYVVRERLQEEVAAFVHDQDEVRSLLQHPFR